MGDICHKFFLVVLRAGDLACHVIQTGGEITDLIFAFHLKFVVHISRRILLRRIGDLAQRNVDNLREENQDNQGEQQQDNQCNIGNVQHTVAGGLNVIHVAENDNITLHHIAGRDRCKHTEHIRVEISEEIIYHIVGAARHGRVEILYHDDILNVQRLAGVQNQTAGGVDDADRGIQIDRKKVELGLHRFQIRFTGVQAGGVGI